MVSVLNSSFNEYFSPAPIPTPPPHTAPLAFPRQRKYIAADALAEPAVVAPSTYQPYDAFLVLDVEATCIQGGDFSYPNEIIEWPVCLLKWTDRDDNGFGSKLEVVAQFRSFVRPIWRPTLSAFCTQLTGITQDQVNDAPTFPQVLARFSSFLAEHGLVHPSSGARLARFCWCTDGPYDIRDFVIKQCFISKIRVPYWLQGDVLDVRNSVSRWVNFNAIYSQASLHRQVLNIPRQLHVLGLSEFEGRQHSGIDDTRNIARIVIELARHGLRLQPNVPIRMGRRWYWMGKSGEIIEDYVPRDPALAL